MAENFKSRRTSRMKSGDDSFEKKSSASRPKRKRIYRSNSGDERPFERKIFPRAEEGSEKPFGERRNFDRPSGERNYERKPFGERRFSDKPRGERTYERKPFGDRKFSDKPSGERNYERKPFGDKRKFDNDKSGKNFNRKKEFSRPAPKSFERKSSDDLIRLNRFISNSGICSRRQADDLITAGLISVNGEIITTLGTKVKPGDVVRYNNEIVKGERLVYLLLNKPKDFITTMDDPEQRNTVMQLVANACSERIYPVGRLDRNTTGLLLFTNDGEMAKKLTHPSSDIKKIYHVELDKKLKPDDLKKIHEGVELEDGIAHVDEIAYDTGFGDRSQIGIELHSGKNRIVRRIFETLGYDVYKLDRVVFAGLTKKDLPRGRWRFLTDMEVNMLKMITDGKKRQEV